MLDNNTTSISNDTFDMARFSETLSESFTRYLQEYLIKYQIKKASVETNLNT